MFFNPLFIQSVSDIPSGKTEAGSQSFGKMNKLSNAKYLFSDIIKVLNEPGLATSTPMQEESTNVSTGTELFSFLSSDVSGAGTELFTKNSKITENSINPEILKFINTLCVSNGNEIEAAAPNYEAVAVNEVNTLPNTELPLQIKEFVIQPEKLAEVMNKLAELTLQANPAAAITASSTDLAVSNTGGTKTIPTDILKELETKGSAVIEIKSGENCFRFTITKSAQLENENIETGTAAAAEETVINALPNESKSGNKKTALYSAENSSKNDPAVYAAGVTLADELIQPDLSQKENTSAGNATSHPHQKDSPVSDDAASIKNEEKAVSAISTTLQKEEIVVAKQDSPSASAAISSEIGVVGVSRDTKSSNDDTNLMSGDAKATNGDAIRMSGDAKATNGDASRMSGDAKVTNGDASRMSGEAKATTGDASGMFGDAKATTGDASGMSGDAKVTNGDASRVSENAIPANDHLKNLSYDEAPSNHKNDEVIEKTFPEQKENPNAGKVVTTSAEHVFQADDNSAEVSSSLFSERSDEQSGAKMKQSANAEVKTFHDEAYSITKSQIADGHKVNSQTTDSQSVQPEKIINKISGSRLNLNPDEAINTLKTEPVKANKPEYKIVVEIEKNISPKNTAQNEIDPTQNVKPAGQQIVIKTNRFTSDTKNLNANISQTQNPNQVKQSSNAVITKVLPENELPFSPKFVIEGNKINLLPKPETVEPADIKLLKVLAHTKDSLIALSKPETNIKPEAATSSKVLFGEAKELAVNEASPETVVKINNSERDVQSNIKDEPAIVKSTVEQVAPKVSHHKTAVDAKQRVHEKSIAQEVKAIDHPAELKEVIQTEAVNTAPIADETVIAKNTQSIDTKNNSADANKISTQKDTGKAEVKGVLNESGTYAKTSDDDLQNEEFEHANHAKEIGTDETAGTEKSKSGETQRPILNAHQTNEVKTISPKEKIFTAPSPSTETEKTIKSFELSKEISKIIESGTSQKVVLRLLPEALGKVKLTLEVGGEIIHAKAEVENESVKQMIQTNTDTLKQTLSQNGMQLASFTVSLAGSDEKQQKANAQKKKPHNYGGKTRIDRQPLPDAVRKLGYNTYEYLA